MTEPQEYTSHELAEVLRRFPDLPVVVGQKGVEPAPQLRFVVGPDGVGAARLEIRIAPEGGRIVIHTFRSIRLDTGVVWCESRNPVEVVTRSTGFECRFEKLVAFEQPSFWEPWDGKILMD